MKNVKNLLDNIIRLSRSVTKLLQEKKKWKRKV